MRLIRTRVGFSVFALCFAVAIAAPAVEGKDDTGDTQAQLGERAKEKLKPQRSGIDHIVVVMMENRSFDHLLGWLPNADAMQAGLS